jgi:hypothetical protein
MVRWPCCSGSTAARSACRCAPSVGVEKRTKCCLLEAARLDLLALFRALDRLDLTADEIPQPLLRELFVLDADFAEALHVLDFPTRGLDIRAMVADTRASLRRAPATRQRFLAELATILPALTREDARNSIPAQDPRCG